MAKMLMSTLMIFQFADLLAAKERIMAEICRIGRKKLKFLKDEPFTNVYLFIPNIIGYVRIFLAFGAFYCMQTYPVSAVFLYLSSYFLDEFDGRAARAFNQVTSYGSLLDMLIDRCATTCLLLVLSVCYPQWIIAFQLLICLDITSHWVHMYSSIMTGSSNHKCLAESANALLKIYYTSSVVMSIICGGNEFFLVTLYLLHYVDGPMVTLWVWHFDALWTIAVCCLPCFVLKNYLNTVQMLDAFKSIVHRDIENRRREFK